MTERLRALLGPESGGGPATMAEAAGSPALGEVFVADELTLVTGDASEPGADVNAAPEEAASLEPASAATLSPRLRAATEDPTPARRGTQPRRRTRAASETTPAPVAEPPTAAPAPLDPTSPRGDIRHVIAAIRSVGEPEADPVVSGPSQPSSTAAAHAAALAPSTPPAPTGIAERSVDPARGTPSAPAVAPTPPAVAAAPPAPRAAVVYAALNTSPPAPWYHSARFELRLAGIAATIVAVALAAGFAVSSLTPRTYAARTDVVFPVDSDRASGFLREDRRMLTHVEGLQSRTVLQPAAKEESLAVEDLEKQVQIEVVNGSEVIRIEVWDQDAQRALRLATRITALYRSSLRTDSGLTRAQDVLYREQEALQERIAAISTRLQELAPTIASTADLAGSERARREAGQLEAEAFRTYERIANVSNRLNDLAVSNARLAPTTTVAEPYVLPDQVRPRPLWDVALAGSVGAVVAGAVVAFLWWRRTPEAG